MNIIGWLLFGLVVGAIAKFLMPGRDPGGWIVTILLGIAGSFVGGFLASMLGHKEQTAGWIGSILRAIVLLFIYPPILRRRAVAGRHRTLPRPAPSGPPNRGFFLPRKVRFHGRRGPNRRLPPSCPLRPPKWGLFFAPEGTLQRPTMFFVP